MYFTRSIVMPRFKGPELQSPVRDHQMLAQSFVNSCTKRDGKYISRWSGDQPTEADMLLDYHALLNNVGKLQRAFMKLSLLLSYHKVYRVQLSTFCDQIKAMEAFPNQSCPFFTPKPELVVHLFNDFEKQTSACIDAIMRDSDTQCYRGFQQTVQSFHQLYSFKPLTDHLPPGSKSMDEVLERCTAIIVANWFLDQYTKFFLKTGKETSQNAFKTLMEQCVDQLKKGFRLNSYFSKAGINFFSHFYVAFDKLTSAEGETRVCRANDFSLYPIYQSFQTISALSEKIDESHIHKGLHLTKSINWFERCNSVPSWIQCALEKCKKCIRNSVADDSLVAINEAVNYSTSAYYTETFLLRVSSFWKNLKWPDPLMSYCYAVMVVNGIAECATYYVSLIAKNMDCSINELFDKDGEFIASEKLPLFLNNTNYVRENLSMCTERLELQPFYNWLEENQKIGTKCQCLVKKILDEADEELYSHTQRVIVKIANELVPRIQQYLEEMMRNKGKTDAEEFYAPLMDYLYKNLKAFTSSLYPSVTKIILHQLWWASTDSVEKCLSEVKRTKDAPQLYYGKLFTTLAVLKEFFYLGGRGIPLEEINTKKFRELHSKLEILGLQTDHLACHYLSQLAGLKYQCDETEEEVTSRTLRFSVAYLKEKSTVEVVVLQAKNLSPLDSDGLCDPYVKASLMPPWMFPEATSKTEERKNTLNPLFNEELKLPASEENLDTEGAVLLLTVWDNDMIKDDFAGLCVMPCKDIPRLRVTTEQQALLSDKVPERKVLTLSLFCPALNESTLRAELESRAKVNDTKAKQITKAVPVLK